jgi:hypothetical protein
MSNPFIEDHSEYELLAVLVGLWTAKGTRNPRHCCQSYKDPFG